VHEATPDSASEPAQLIVTAWLYQPFASGVRLALAVTPGAVSSNLSGKEIDELVFPALSMHVPVGVAFAESGPL
jgi:hypothetical protein